MMTDPEKRLLREFLKLQDDFRRATQRVLLAPASCGFRPEPVWHPPTDVFTTDDKIVVRIEIAGLRPEQISVVLKSDDVLVISGHRGEPTPRKLGFLQMEISYGRFERALKLPSGVDASKISPVYKDGFLEIVIPKPDQSPNVVRIRPKGT